jgi:NitT/TauT family transport system substrate-binding protein
MRLTAAGISRPARTEHAPDQARPARFPAPARPIRGRSAPLGGGRRMRRGALSLAALSALALAAGCSAGGSASGAAGTITIGAVPGVDTVPLFSAEHSGQFSAGGVSVQIKKYASVAAEVSALKNGQIDMAAGDYGPFLYAQSQQKASGPQIKIVADGYDATQGVLEVLAKPGSGITSPQDLTGKTIAAPSEAVLPKSASAAASTANGSGAPDSLDTAATTSVLRSYGINMGTVTWKVMSQSAEIAALRDGSVQAILVNEPYLYQAQSELGAIEVLDACSGATAGLPLSGYFAMSTWTGGHAAAVRDFKSVLDKSQATAAMDGPVQNNLPGYTGMTKLEANLVTLGTYPSTTNSSEVQRVSQLMNLQGVLSVQVAVGNMIIH